MKTIAALSLAVVLSATGIRAQPVLSFEVASIRPTTDESRRGKGGGLMPRGSGGVLDPKGTFWQARNISLRRLIHFAYGSRNTGAGAVVPLEAARLVGAPSWIDDVVFDVEARMPERVHVPGDSALMVQTLLAERFALRVHRETREMSVYALVPAKEGAARDPRLRPASETCVARAQRVGRDQIQCGIRGGTDRIAGDSVSMERFAAALSPLVGRVVVDRTGLAGTFDFLLRFAAEPGPQATLPSVPQALREQLGLKLESIRAPIEVVVIGHVERPTEN